MGESIWTYDPNFPVSIVFAVFYAIPLFVQGYQTFIRYRSYYFWVVFVGALLEVGGYAARTVAIKHLDQIVRTPEKAETQTIELTSCPIAPLRRPKLPRYHRPYLHWRW